MRIWSSPRQQSPTSMIDLQIDLRAQTTSTPHGHPRDVSFNPEQTATVTFAVESPSPVGSG